MKAEEIIYDNKRKKKQQNNIAQKVHRANRWGAEHSPWKIKTKEVKQMNVVHVQSNVKYWEHWTSFPIVKYNSTSAPKEGFVHMEKNTNSIS